MIEIIQKYRDLIVFIVPGLILVPIMILSERTKLLKKDGFIISKYHFGMRLLGIGFLVFLIFVVKPYLIGEGNSATATPLVAILITFLFGYMFVETNFVKIKLDEKYIHTFSPFRLFRKIPIQEVTDLTYSDTFSWHILKTRNHGNVFLSDFLIGKEELLSNINKKKKSLLASSKKRI